MTTRDYVFRLRGDADQLAQAHERAAAAADKHADQTADLARQQAAAKGASEGFLATLKRQADAAGRTRAELLTLQAAELGVSDKAAPMIARVAAADQRFQSFNKTGRLTALELQQVGFQLNDLAVQVASGQNPITALVQQGSQLSGTFGGITPALRAVASLITPLRVAIGGTAAGVGLLAAAYLAGQKEDARFRDSIVLTGNAAGQTRDSYAALAVTLRNAAGVSIGAAREIAQGLVATGRVGPAAIGLVAQAAATLARVSGQSAEDVVKQFAGMADGVAKWAYDANKAYNFLTPEVYRHIRALEAQGKTEEAMAVASQALNTALASRKRELGLLESVWDGIGKAASAAWDAMLNVGRADTTGEQVQQLMANLALARERLAQAEKRSSTGGGPDVERRRAVVAQLEANLAALQQRDRAEQDAAAKQAADAKENSQALLREQADYQQASQALQRSGFGLAQAQAQAVREAELVAVERSYDVGLLSLAGYAQARGRLEQQILDDKRAAIDKDIELERGRQPGTPAEAANQSARVNDLLARRAGLGGEQAKLDEQVRVAFGKKAREDTLGAFIDDQLNAAKRRDEQRLEQAIKAADDLAKTNRELGIGLIRDERARGEALIALEAEQLRTRLDLAARSAEDRAAVEGRLAEFIVLRQRQLTEQLKPEYQRMLEDWADTTQLMRETGDRFMSGFLQNGEQTWLEVARGGKLSIQGLVDFTRDELARLVYRQDIAPAIAEVGKSIAGAIGIKLPGAAADGGVAAGKAAEAAATANTTTALVAMTTTGVAPSSAALSGLTLAANAAAAALANVGAGAGGGGIASAIGEWFGAGGGGEGSGVGLPGVGDGGGMSFPFAKGGTFTNRIVNEPTPIRFARGDTLQRGVMGEAGPEGIFPLRRNARGELGVMAAGGGASSAPQVIVNVHGAPSQPRVQQRQTGRGTEIDLVFEQFEQRLGERVGNGLGLAKDVGGRFGLGDGGGLMR
jgi:phage-related minor tail protein